MLAIKSVINNIIIFIFLIFSSLVGDSIGPGVWTARGDGVGGVSCRTCTIKARNLCRIKCTVPNACIIYLILKKMHSKPLVCLRLEYRTNKRPVEVSSLSF